MFELGNQSSQTLRFGKALLYHFKPILLRLAGFFCGTDALEKTGALRQHTPRFICRRQRFGGAATLPFNVPHRCAASPPPGGMCGKRLLQGVRPVCPSVSAKAEPPLALSQYLRRDWHPCKYWSAAPTAPCFIRRRRRFGAVATRSAVAKPAVQTVRRPVKSLRTKNRAN